MRCCVVVVWLCRCRCCCCCDAGAVTLYATGIPVVVAGGAVVAAAAVVALAVDVDISVAVAVALMLLRLQPLPLLRLLPLLLVLGYVAGAAQHPNVVVASVADDSPVHLRPQNALWPPTSKAWGSQKWQAHSYNPRGYGVHGREEKAGQPLADPRPRPPRSPLRQCCT